MNFSKRLRAEGKGFRLADRDPKFHGDLSRESAEALQSAQLVELQSFQDRLYAADTHSVLFVLQGMDAAGKDGIIKHVMSGVNPAGCEVHPFKAPSAMELDHDYLWRCHQKVPERGRIGIFNRSYYEEVLVVRVHVPRSVRSSAQIHLEHFCARCVAISRSCTTTLKSRS